LDLPKFKYHSDPIATGSVAESENICACCEQERGYIYSGPVYSEADHEDDICPWCIADGTAHEKFGASFIDIDGVGGLGDWEEVPPETSAEVAFRTPGFTGWQQERWFTCCSDAACFLGRAGYKELLAFGPAAIEAIRAELGWEEEEWKKFGGYSDFT
jgi:uncharacterized protein CbrC (UPF0167 family)